MYRFYMTPETRQALIEESNRLIARRAARMEGRHERSTSASWDETEPAVLQLDGGADDAAQVTSGSAFARLVSELQALPGSSALPLRWHEEPKARTRRHGPITAPIWNSASLG